jgi:hypothetical protein
VGNDFVGIGFVGIYLVGDCGTNDWVHPCFWFTIISATSELQDGMDNLA